MATQCEAQFEPFAWSLTREAIGQALRKRYAVPTELPPKLLALVKIFALVEGKHRLRTPISIFDGVKLIEARPIQDD